VSVRLAAPSAAARATIGASGGTLAVRTANGTAFTLVVPAGALSQDVQITMTPVTAIGRSPFRRPIVGAVQLQPEGLLFLRTATLTIRPRRSASLRLLAPFSARGDGRSFHPYPPARGTTATRLVLGIGHFCLFGDGQATRTELQQVVTGHPPSDALENAEARAAVAALSSLMKGRPNLSDPGVQDTLARIYLPVFRAVARNMKLAESDDALLEPALRDALTLDRELGFINPVERRAFEWVPPKTRSKALEKALGAFRDQIAASVRYRALDTAYDRSVAACAAHDLTKLARMLTIDRWRQLLGGESRGLRDLAACMTFRLEAVTRFDDEWTDLGMNLESCRAPTTEHKSMRVETLIPLTAVEESWKGRVVTLEGTAGSTFGDLSWTRDMPSDCWPDPGTLVKDRTFPGQVRAQVTIRIPEQQPAGGLPPLATTAPAPELVSVILTPGDSTATWRVEGTTFPVAAPDEPSLYRDGWRMGHAAERQGDQDVYLIAGWLPGSDDAVWTTTVGTSTTYASSLGSGGHTHRIGTHWQGTITEASSFTIRHAAPA
jgi:hypothetical protein